MGIPEKIQAIEDELHRTNVNKATEHHVGLLKAKLAKLRRELEESKQPKTGGRGGRFGIKKAGDATVVILGLPNVGKSTLLNRLTNAKSPVGAYQFSTVTVYPGMMEYRGAKIQIFDLPGIIKGAASGRGLGKRVLSVARGADLVLLLLDVFQPDQAPFMRRELEEMGIRLDEKPLGVVVEKTATGGVTVNTQGSLRGISENLIKGILRVYGVHNARVLVREDFTVDQFIDVISGNRVYPPSLTAINKIDLVTQGFLDELKERFKTGFIPISAKSNENVDILKEAVYRKLNFIRIYLRPKGGETDYEEPLIIRNGSTIRDVCNKIHRDLERGFKHALVWGKSVKFQGQKVGINHLLSNEDVLTIVKKKSLVLEADRVKKGRG